ncbi:MAG TPA: hypothetical protein VEA99_04875 [Gemmatimonadaceae bacterium]|nr:hypothetical protein [Gemmatimonadaceae bacterium]
MRKEPTLLLVAALTLACRAPESALTPTAGLHAHEGTPATIQVPRDLDEQIDELRAVTKPYRKFDGAVEAGWSTPVPGCFDNQPTGAMGYHYLNANRLDATVDRLAPEILVYEPIGNGQMRLVAVEYAVPWTAWTSPTPPSLYGQPFHRNNQFQLWVLHVWHEKTNTAGLFADWNPNVRCR